MRAEKSVGVYVTFAFCLVVVTDIRILVKFIISNFMKTHSANLIFSRTDKYFDANRGIFTIFLYKCAMNIIKIYIFKFISVNFEVPEVNKAQISL